MQKVSICTAVESGISTKKEINMLTYLARFTSTKIITLNRTYRKEEELHPLSID
jgi:hypothetical protein